MKPSKKKLLEQQKMQKTFAKWIESLGSLLVLGVFIIQPLFVSDLNNVYANITASKLFCFVGILSVSVFLLLIVMILKAVYASDSIFIPSPEGFKGVLRAVRPYEWAVIAYWLVMLVSTLLSNNRYAALIGTSARNEGLLMMTAYLAAVLVAGRVYRPKSRHFGALSAVACLVSGYGILQYYDIDPLYFSPDAWNFGPRMVFISTMSNRNMLSTYLAIVFCIAAVLFAQGAKRSRWGYLAVGMITFYMLALGQTESGYLGLLVAFLFIFPFIAKNRIAAGGLLLYLSTCPLLIWVSLRMNIVIVNKGQGWSVPFWQPFDKYTLPLFFALLAAAMILLFVKKLPVIPQKFYRIGWCSLVVLMVVVVLVSVPRIAAVSDYATIEELNQILQGNLDDRFGSWRGFIWKRAVTLIPERPLFGYGPDNFAIAFNEVFHEESGLVTNQIYDKAHNEYIQQLVDNGIIGLIAFLAFFAVIIFSARKHAKNPPVLALIMAAVCFLGQAFFNFSTPFAHPVTWVLWGVLAGYPFLPENQNAKAVE